MQSVISERAKIREYDADQILEIADMLSKEYNDMPAQGYIPISIAEIWNELSRNYKQLTGLSIYRALYPHHLNMMCCG